MSVVTPAFKQFGERKRPGFSRRSRETSVGASEIGQCERKIGYEKHDADHRSDNLPSSLLALDVRASDIHHTTLRNWRSIGRNSVSLWEHSEISLR